MTDSETGNLIEQSIFAQFGGRCPDFDPDCWCCKAWAEYDALRAATQWRPIETAPRDGTSFLAYGSYHYPDDAHPTEYQEIVQYSGNDAWPWSDWEGVHPPQFFTHWMPLPAPPTEDSTHD